MEYHDGKPVSRHEAWFRRRVFEVAEADARWLAEDAVQLWLVLGVSRESSYRKRRDDPDSKTRTCVIDIDTVTPLTGDLRDQAAAYIAGDERRGELTDQAAELELDRLRNYLQACWPNDVEEASEPTVDAVIRLLETRSEVPPTIQRFTIPDELEEPEPLARLGVGPVPWEHFTGPADVDDIERVGSVYRRPSKTRAVLERAFGED